jgi:hypothetical protein
MEARPESNTDPSHSRLLLQTLLTDRFRLALRRESSPLFRSLEDFFDSPLDNREDYGIPLAYLEEIGSWGKSRATWCRERWRC